MHRDGILCKVSYLMSGKEIRMARYSMTSLGVIEPGEYIEAV